MWLLMTSTFTPVSVSPATAASLLVHELSPCEVCRRGSTLPSQDLASLEELCPCYLIVKEPLQGEEVAELVKHLLWKLEDLSSSLRTHVKS